MSSQVVDAAYLVAAILFIVGLKGLSHPRSAVRGNFLGALAMLIAIVVTLIDQEVMNWVWIV
ncbi:MAG: NAD(P)(+) transhydrogenase (Re/Si-specific) subunit beta, partial [Spirochaetota bacterium]